MLPTAPDRSRPLPTAPPTAQTRPLAPDPWTRGPPRLEQERDERGGVDEERVDDDLAERRGRDLAAERTCTSRSGRSFLSVLSGEVISRG